MGVFNPDKFLESTTTDASSTSRNPVPEGEYKATVDDLEVRNVETKRGERQILRILWEIHDDEAKAATGLDRVIVRQDLWLDLNDRGGLDTGKGKNVSLGRVREALGQNTPGEAWNPGMLKGAGPALLVVIERPDHASDAIYNDVKSVGRLT
jgi:hypothetical protein